MKLLTICLGISIRILCPCLLMAQNRPTKPPAISVPELMRRTEELYDSIPSGDRRPWEKYYADDGIEYDQKGRTMDKAALVTDVAPMPAGYSGTIKIVEPHVTFAPGVAVFGYGLQETEHVFGQVLHARYHCVDTWLYRNGSWQIVTTQAMRYYEDSTRGLKKSIKSERLLGNL